jgi:hypothetical protein
MCDLASHVAERSSSLAAPRDALVAGAITSSVAWWMSKAIAERTLPSRAER